MASKEAHQSTGWAAGLIAAAVVSQAGSSGPFHVWSILAFLMGYAGGGAPDWLELSWWSTGRGRHSWIAHRTLTHWGVAWIALLVISYHGLRHSPVMALLFGFAAGGIMHLLADWPNPLGVPWLWVSRRHSLKWWNSGRADWIIIVTAWTAGLVMADYTWFHSTGFHTIARFLTKWA